MSVDDVLCDPACFSTRCVTTSCPKINVSSYDADTTPQSGHPSRWTREARHPVLNLLAVAWMSSQTKAFHQGGAYVRFGGKMKQKELFTTMDRKQKMMSRTLEKIREKLFWEEVGLGGQDFCGGT